MFPFIVVTSGPTVCVCAWDSHMPLPHIKYFAYFSGLRHWEHYMHSESNDYENDDDNNDDDECVNNKKQQKDT